ncbi:hypothetical protein F443_22193 [Phytophthora nicotianae P1569]|uniref:Uncharacterized protein n=1 Tax=Phytophthora nicotianae P1569 TaxID=1317065 RepID=V9DVM2_PHYNI|nr:hypothetical protein F443_22193 [Phytophthora nicotianae P1569]
METKADLSGNESDATVVLEYTDGDDEGGSSSLQVEPTQQDDGIGMVAQNRMEPAPPKATFKSVGFYNTLGEAEGALHGFNRFVYTYRTRYSSPFVFGKVYQCQSHIGCGHRLKLSTHRANKRLFSISFCNVAITLAQLFNFQHEEFLPL